jgi:prephenate dehydrogenase
MREIKKIVIYSVGLLGSSLGAAFKQSGFTGEIVGISAPNSIVESLEIGSIDSGYSYDETQEAIKDADIIFLCSPIMPILKTIESLSKLNLPDGVIISDVGSTKQEIISTAEKLLPKNVNFIGGHPMAGSEKRGALAADPFLFQNAVFVLAQSNLSTLNLLNEFGAYLEKHLGCRTVLLNPQTHDTIAATVSHVPHIVASAMVNFASEVDAEIPGTLSLAAGGFRSLTRIAASPYKMWHDIFATNRKENSRLLGRFIDILKEMRSDLNSDSLKEPFDKAAEIRQGLSVNGKGFLGPLFQIVVVAEDRPGFLSKMTSIVAEAELNIRDIELLKVREGESGTFMLAFGDFEESNSAVDILNRSGFSARIVS